MNEVFFPVIQFLKLLKLFIILIYEIITPVLRFGIEILKLKLSLVKLIFYMPTMSFLKIILLVKDGFIGFYQISKELINGLKVIKRVIIPAAKSAAENKEATMSII